jgi:hypothetical protein
MKVMRKPLMLVKHHEPSSEDGDSTSHVVTDVLSV